MNPELETRLEQREALVARVQRILAEDLRLPYPPEAIDPDAALFGSGLGLDSVDALELVVAAETAFHVGLPVERLRASLRTVNSLVDLVLELRSEVTP